MFPNAFVPVVTISLADEDGYVREKDEKFSFKADDTFGDRVSRSNLPQVVKQAVLEIAENLRFYLPDATLHVLDGETKHVVKIKIR